MTLLISDDDSSSWWPLITPNIFSSYWIVASSAIAIYDWALIIGQEVELVWSQRWSFMTISYLIVRYIEIPYIAMNLLQNLPSVSATNAACENFFFAQLVMYIVTNTVVSVIVITRLHAMYQQSKKMLIFLVVIFLAVTIACVVLAIMALRHILGEELILSSTYQCNIFLDEGAALLVAMIWTLTAVWEILALCLAVWIAVKHFCELRQIPGRGIIRDCFTVLIQTHLFYFASFVAVSCLSLMDSFAGAETSGGLREICLVMQIFVLGPRLIFSVRKFHAKLVASSDEVTSMTSIAFQERVHVSMNGNV